jgi:subtilisin family serine protease
MSANAWIARGQDLNLSIPPQNAHKLINSQDILSGFEDSQSTVRVIVNLFEPNEAKQKAVWKSQASRDALRARIRTRQLEVLSTLEGREFRLRHNFDNQAGFSGYITIDGLNKLLADPRVRSIEPVYLEQIHLAQGIPLIDGITYRSIYDGTGVAIAVTDTGIDYTHPRFGGGGFPNSKVIGGYDFGDDDSDPMPNSQAHGTCCAGIAAGDLGTSGDYIGGVAPNAKLYALKVTFGSGGSAYTDDIIDAWNWCITHKDDDPNNPVLVISNSMGGGRYYSDCDSSSTAYANAANNAAAAGITILSSSGNDGYCDSISRPACLSNVISVGAVYDAAFGTYYPCVNAASCADKFPTTGCTTGWYAIDTTAADMVTSYSNTASFLDLFAPSNKAYTTDIAGSGGYSSGDYYSSFGGTSAACPYAAGAVAALQSAAKAVNGDYLSPSQIRTILTQAGELITDGKVAITKPRVNLQQAIETLVPVGPQPPVAKDVNVSTLINTPVTIELIGDDDGLPDPPAALDYIVSSLPANGELSDPNAAAITAVPYTLTGGGNEVIYTPDPNYFGIDSFMYKINDGGTEPNGGDSNTATVSINVIDAIYIANMDTNPGWSLTGQWQWGVPTGQGGTSYGNPDPAGGYTGSNVCGVNLDGDYSTTVGGPYYLTTQTINCSGYENIHLKFYRWLNSDYQPYVDANVEVSNNASTWTTIWENGGSPAVTDDSWQLVDYDISSVADNEPNVYIRWGYSVASAAFAYSGWNIDDVELNGALIPPQQYTLTVSSTPGGLVTTPGEGSFLYNDGTVVDINAVAEPAYHFVNWTGDTTTIADVNASVTTIVVDANYSIQANFAFSPFPPEIISTPVTTAVVGELYAYDVDANGLPAPTFSLVTSPNDMTIDVNTGLIEWIPAEQDIGPNVPVTVQATNTEGFDQQSFEIDVNGITPTITSLPITTATAGFLYSYDVDANGIPAPTYSLITSPNDMTIDVNTGLIEWLPTEQDIGPNVPVTVRATNIEGFDQQSFEIDVNGIAPVITSSPITTASADLLYSYDVDANGIPAPTYSLITSPNDMTIDPNTGLIEWTPDYFDIAQYHPVTVEATNLQGSQQQFFEIEVFVGDSFDDNRRGATWRLLKGN